MDIAIGTLRSEDGRNVGQRLVHSNVLENSLALMNELGETEAALAVSRWPGGTGRVPGATALKHAMVKVGQHRKTFLDKGMTRQAAYCEIVAYCVQACLDESGVT